MDFSRKVNKSQLGKKNAVKRSGAVYNNVQLEAPQNQQAFIDQQHAKPVAPAKKKPGIVRPINTQDIRFQRSAIEKRKQEEIEAQKQRASLMDKFNEQVEEYQKQEEAQQPERPVSNKPSFMKPAPAGNPLSPALLNRQLNQWAEKALDDEYRAIVSPHIEMPPWLEEKQEPMGMSGEDYYSHMQEVTKTLEASRGTVLPGGIPMADLFGKKKPVKVVAPIKKPVVVKPAGPSFLKTAVKGGPGSHLAIKALAGTGKTFTIIEGIKKVIGLRSDVVGSEQQEAIWAKMKEGATPRSVHFAAFNNSIARELDSRVPTASQLPEGTSVTVSTVHAMGVKAIRECGFGTVKINKYRSKTALLLEEGWDDDHKKNFPGLAPLCEQVTGLIKVNLMDHTFETKSVLETVAELVAQFGIETTEENMEALIQLLPWLMQEHYDRTHLIDFADMIWFPNVRPECRIRKVDLILVDESQDLNKAQQELVKMAGRRIIMVGDVNQAIYGFAGADAYAMGNMISSLEKTVEGCQTLELTFTRRCSKAVVALAQELVPGLEAMPEAPEGAVVRNREEDGLAHVGENDMVVCRTNAPLISQCLRFLRAGRKARMQGRDIGDDLIELIKKQGEDYTKNMLEKLDDWFGREVERVSRRKMGSEGALINLQDKYDSVLAFSEGTKYTQEIIRKINDLFDDKSTRGTLFSSIHKAKGLEAENVVFLQEDKCPHPMARTPQAREQEYNLRYVAITRAKNTIYMTRSATKQKAQIE